MTDETNQGQAEHFSGGKNKDRKCLVGRDDQAIKKRLKKKNFKMFICENFCPL